MNAQSPCPVEYVPAPHSRQVIAPTVSAYFPAVHKVHPDDPDPEAKVPDWQALHQSGPVAAMPVENRPGVQTAQEKKPEITMRTKDIN